MKENKEFYVMVQGKKVFVSEEVYRAYVRPIRKEQRKERRDWKCRIVGEKGNLIRCNKNCNECEYAETGNKATGNILSLDKLLEKGIEIADEHLTPEELYIEKERRTSLQESLQKALSQLTSRQREIVVMHFFEYKSQEEICQMLGLTKGTVSLNLKRALINLRKILQK